MRTIGYARVSKREQAENSHALEQQQARLVASGATEIYTDIISGTKSHRPAFNKVMSFVAEDCVETVIVTRIDRLGRSIVTLKKTLDQFRDSSAKLRVLDSSIDLETVSGRTHANIMAVFAEMESEMISERSRHGWEYLRSRKVAMNPPFGYIKVDDRHKIDTTPFLCLRASRDELSKSAISRNVINTFLEVQSLRATIKRINEKYGIQHFNHHYPKTGFAVGKIFHFSPSGLKAWLNNPVLRGHLSYLNKSKSPVIFYNTHPQERLITEAEYEQIQDISKYNGYRRGWGFIAPKYPLTGLVYCAVCGASCYSSIMKSEKKTYYYFKCKNSALSCCTESRAINMEPCEEAVIKALNARAQLLSELVLRAEVPRTESKELLELRSQLKSLQQLGKNPAIDAAIADIKVQIENLSQQSITDSNSTCANTKLLIETFSDSNYWRTLEDAQKREIYRGLVSKVLIKDGKCNEVFLKM